MMHAPRTPKTLEVTLALLARLPLQFLHALGALTGEVLARTSNRPRRIAEANLALCFPEQTPTERRRMTRQALRETSKAALEIGPLFKRSPEHLLRWVRTVNGAEHLDAAIQKGSGCLLLAPHIGCWELLNLWVAARHPLTALYRPPRQPWLEPLLLEARTRNGARMLPAGPQGVRGVLRALRHGEVVGILPDQEPDGHEPFAPFFGVPAKTMTLASRVAERSGASVLFAMAARRPHGDGFDLHFFPAEAQIASPDAETATAALNRGVEECVRLAPAQYQWTYKRFNTQPDGSRPYPARRKHGGA